MQEGLLDLCLIGLEQRTRVHAALIHLHSPDIHELIRHLQPTVEALAKLLAVPKVVDHGADLVAVEDEEAEGHLVHAGGDELREQRAVVQRPHGAVHAHVAVEVLPHALGLLQTQVDGVVEVPVFAILNLPFSDGVAEGRHGAGHALEDVDRVAEHGICGPVLAGDEGGAGDGGVVGALVQSREGNDGRRDCSGHEESNRRESVEKHCCLG